MESIQLIRTRMQSISSTRQITQSMRLVSTAKVKKARERMERNRPFFQQINQLVNNVARSGGTSRHPYLTEREQRSAAIIVISGDRGLCGGYNINVCKEAIGLAGRLKGVRMIPVGAKAHAYCRRRHKTVEQAFQEFSENPFYEDAKEVAAIPLKLYDSGEVDAVYLCYTKYESMLIQNATTVRLLPLEQGTPPETAPALMRYENGEETFLNKVVPAYVTAVVYGAMLEAAACEHAARITSMDAAVKNSTEIIDHLTLLHNRIRQGTITQELTEIVGGASALENKG